MVFEHWFRISVGSEISIHNIANIAAKFAEAELFEAALCHEKIQIKKEGQVIYREGLYLAACNAYGSFTATPGGKYHWKLKVIQCNDVQINIGIMEDNKAPNLIKDAWWTKLNGYSYFSGSGEIFSGSIEYSKCVPFGDKYGTGDIIDIWLDLRNKGELSFAKNDAKMGKILDFLNKDISYKLAIAMHAYTKEIEILSFEITD